MSKEIYNKNANEKALLEEAYSNVYKPKVIEERLVDGKLMCPEACCGEPVMECSCGPKCEHCNCDEIQKLAEKKGISINEAAEIINEVAPMLAAAGRALAPAAKQVGAAAVTGAAAGAHDKAKSMVSGQPSDEEEPPGDHAKGVKMALEALEMFKDELHIEGHPEDINVNEVADAHEQLVRALNIIFDPEDVDYITGGRDRQFGEEAMRARFEDMRDYEEHGN